MPKEIMENSSLHGVEMDEISGKIAKRLFPAANIEVKPFQQSTAAMSDDKTYDVIIGNVPFSDTKIYDSELGTALSTHDYFFSKAVEKLRPGGCIAFITSKYTMDSKDKLLREMLSADCDLVTAVRLHNKAFKTAGTETESDVIILRKRKDGEERKSNKWHNVSEKYLSATVREKGGEREGYCYWKANEWYHKNPENVLGRLVYSSGKFGWDTRVEPKSEQDLAEDMREILGKAEAVCNPQAPQNDSDREDFAAEEEIEGTIPAGEFHREYTYTIAGNRLYYCENRKLTPVAGHGKDSKTYDRILAMTRVTDKLYEIIDSQVRGYAAGTRTELRAELAKVYDEFVAKYGYVNDKQNARAFDDDIRQPLLQACESDEANGKRSKMSVFHKDTVRVYSRLN
jgi:hypothetical protein